MAFRCPKGYTAYGDVSDVVVENIAKELIIIEEYLPQEDRKIFKQVENKSNRLVIFEMLERDLKKDNKISTYVESIQKAISENERIECIKYATDFKNKMYIIYEFVPK